MKNSIRIRKILTLCAAAAISATCLCTAVSAEESSAPVSYTYTGEEVVNEVEGRTTTINGTYSNGSSYVSLKGDGTCYFHIVLVNGEKIRANGTYGIQDKEFRASCNKYLVVKDDGSVEAINAYIGVDGQFNTGKTILTISDIKYYKD